MNTILTADIAEKAFLDGTSVFGGRGQGELEGLVSHIECTFDQLSQDPKSATLQETLLSIFRSSRYYIAKEAEVAKRCTKLSQVAEGLREAGKAKEASLVLGDAQRLMHSPGKLWGETLRHAFGDGLERHPHLRPLLTPSFRRITAETAHRRGGWPSRNGR